MLRRIDAGAEEDAEGKEGITMGGDGMSAAVAMVDVEDVEDLGAAAVAVVVVSVFGEAVEKKWLIWAPPPL